MCGIVGVFSKGEAGDGPVGQVAARMCDQLRTLRGDALARRGGGA